MFCRPFEGHQHRQHQTTYKASSFSALIALFFFFFKREHGVYIIPSPSYLLIRRLCDSVILFGILTPVIKLILEAKRFVLQLKSLPFSNPLFLLSFQRSPQEYTETRMSSLLQFRALNRKAMMFIPTSHLKQWLIAQLSSSRQLVKT